MNRVWFTRRLHPLPTLPISTAKHNNPKCAEGRGRLQFNHVVVCFLPRNTQKTVSSDTKGGCEKTSSPCFNHDSTSPRPINGRDGRDAILCVRVHRRTICGRTGARPSQRGQTWIAPNGEDAPQQRMCARVEASTGSRSRFHGDAFRREIPHTPQHGNQVNDGDEIPPRNNLIPSKNRHI